jgi:hypothetical protein
MEFVTTHETDGVARLTDRMRKPKLSALLAAWLAEVQEIEQASWDQLTRRSPETAQGAVLDVLGKLVGQSRQGLPDDRYRIWISGRVLANRSSGKTEQLLAIATKLCGDVWHEEQYPAAFTIHAQEPIPGIGGQEVAKLLRLAKAAGVMMHFRWGDTARSLRFAATGASVFDSDRGFSLSQLSAVSDGRDIGQLRGRASGGGSSALLVVL